MNGPAERPDLTITIVNWNARDELLRCLDCLPAAVGSLAAEVVVVDNASRDDSVAVVRERHPEVGVIESAENLGFAGGIDAGLAVARGAFFATLNPDVYPEPGSLEVVVRSLERHPEAALAGPRVLDRHGRTIEQDFALPGLRSALRRLPGLAALAQALGVRRSDELSGKRRVERVNGCCMVFRTGLLREVGGMPREAFLYGEEVSLGGRLRRAGHPVLYVPEARVVHWDGASVDQLWSSEEKLLVFKAARILTARGVMGGGRFAVWNTIFLVREALYSLLRPIARLAGRRWPASPFSELAALHLLGAASVVVPGAERRLRSRYERYVAARRAGSGG